MKIRIWHWILFIWIVLLAARFEAIVNLLHLWYSYAVFFFSDFGSAIEILDFRLIDGLLSIKLFIILPVVIFIFRKKLLFLKTQLNFAYAVLILLLAIFLMAPLVANENPEFQKNLSVTKLLLPLTHVKQLHLKQKNNVDSSPLQGFNQLKNKVLRLSYDESIIFIDSINVADKIYYYQKNKKTELSKEKVVYKNNEPLITEKTFLLGTDEFGRDIFARLVFGSRISLLVGIGSVILSLFIGLTLGFIAGYRGGIIDILLSRLTELFLAFPVIYLVILVLALFGSSLLSVIVVLGVSSWMSLFKIVKSEVLAIKQKDYLITAGLIGLSKKQLLLKEILPVIITPVIVTLVLQFSNVVLAESALSYLGLGTGTSYPSWGAMISSGQEYIMKAWWMIIFPGLSLILTLLSVNVAGRRLNKIYNPRKSL
ncbi:MAG: ABC transporter permease [Ignavibacteriaceae bacterium]